MKTLGKVSRVWNLYLVLFIIYQIALNFYYTLFTTKNPACHSELALLLLNYVGQTFKLVMYINLELPPPKSTYIVLNQKKSLGSQCRRRNLHSPYATYIVCPISFVVCSKNVILFTLKIDIVSFVTSIKMFQEFHDAS